MIDCEVFTARQAWERVAISTIYQLKKSEGIKAW
jgi:hypothetical protein